MQKSGRNVAGKTRQVAKKTKTLVTGRTNNAT